MHTKKTVTTVALTRDAAGRLVKEEMGMDLESMFADLFQNVPPEQRETAAAGFKEAHGKFSSTHYTYDDQGRRVERIMSMGSSASIAQPTFTRTGTIPSRKSTKTGTAKRKSTKPAASSTLRTV